jgi:XapX domain-containing protein
MVKIVFAIVLAVLIGAGCRYFDVPVPAPPKLLGALLVVSLTIGYVGTDWLLKRAAAEEATTAEISGGPSGR